jgi:hypothetical protein
MRFYDNLEPPPPWNRREHLNLFILHNQILILYISTPKIEAVYSSETLVFTYKNAYCHNPVGRETSEIKHEEWKGRNNLHIARLFYGLHIGQCTLLCALLTAKEIKKIIIFSMCAHPQVLTSSGQLTEFNKIRHEENIYNFGFIYGLYCDADSSSGWSVTKELEWTWKETVAPNLRYNPSNCLEGLKKSTKNLNQHCRSKGRDLIAEH